MTTKDINTLYEEQRKAILIKLIPAANDKYFFLEDHVPNITPEEKILFWDLVSAAARSGEGEKRTEEF